MIVTGRDHRCIAAGGVDQGLTEVAGAKLRRPNSAHQNDKRRRKARLVLNAGHGSARKVGADDVEFDS